MYCPTSSLICGHHIAQNRFICFPLACPPSQVLLWERERDRVKHEEGVLLDVSSAHGDAYKRIVDFAVSVGGLLWSSPIAGEGAPGADHWVGGKKLIVVAPRAVEAVSEIVEQNM